MLNEFVYCPRLFFYEWVEGLFAESADTVEGSLSHEKREVKTDELPPGPESEAEQIRSRAVTLSSEQHKLIAKIDLVEGSGGLVSPVDYKRGAPRDADEGPEAWPADRAQICAQAIVLRENNYQCREGIVYYQATKQRVKVEIEDALVEETLRALGEAKKIAARGRIPPPLVDSPKCPRCSLVSICLPDETTLSTALVREATPETQLVLFEPPDDEAGELMEQAASTLDEVRRLVPARDDLRPLYVTGHGLSIGKSDEILQVRDGKRVIQEVRLNEISQVNILGTVHLTSGAIQGLCWAEKPMAHFSSGGWFYGLTRGLDLKNVFLRRDQFRRTDDPAFCLRLARDIVATKIRNQRTLLQRNHLEPSSVVLSRLKELAERAEGASQLETLLGIEGTAARLYFQNFQGMLKVEDAGELPAFDFDGRNRRPPRDPVNALLSLAYSLLVKDLTITCHAIGLDPFIGFYHQPRFGRPALALDLMEGFRPLVADSAVLTAVNTRMVTPRDVIRAGDAVALTPAGRRGFIRAYEQRMDTLVTHPLFGYRVSYRRVLEIQARLLARLITGELGRYPGFETR
jgi:CRISPR-associated protein Cas1